MHKVWIISVAALGLAAFGSVGASAMPLGVAPATTAAPGIIKVAAGCGAGRYRGVGGYCQGHRVPTIKKVCTARRYPGGLVRRCHTYRM